MATDAWVLQALVDASDQAVFALDRDLRYLAFNRAHVEGMRALYGVEIEPGDRLTDYQTVEADRQGAELHLRRALAGERVVVSAFSGEEGRRRYYELVHVPLTRGEEVVGVIVHTRDVTQSRLAEQALREKELSLTTLVDNVPDAVFHLDRDYRLVLGNAAFSEAIAAAGGERILPGDPVLSADFPEEFIALWHGLYDRALAGEAFVVETTVPSTNGVRTMENSLRPVLGDDGEPTGVVATSRDVTERRRTEDVRAFLARTGSRAGDEALLRGAGAASGHQPGHGLRLHRPPRSGRAHGAHARRLDRRPLRGQRLLHAQGHPMRRRGGTEGLLLS
jgi:PAS domain S-box-containing protein